MAGLILAKSQSSRLTSKNILDFHGKPMFLVNVEKCLRVFDDVYVSSDSEEILKITKDAGAKPILRGVELCGDTPNIPVYRHAIEQMGDVDGIVAVQANSPTIPAEIIRRTKKYMEEGVEEIMTAHDDGTLYGSVWAISKKRLEKYKDFYKPEPLLLIFDDSIDIHTSQDYEKALKRYN